MSTIQNWYRGFTAYAATDAGKIGLWNYAVILICALVICVLILLILYSFRTRQMRRERGIKYRISKLISYLCTAYESVQEVDWKHQTTSRFFCDGTKVLVEQRKFGSVADLLGEFHPGDLVRYSPENLRVEFEKAMKTCGMFEFSARIKGKDGNYQWMSFLVQGVRKDKTHNRNFLLLEHRIDDQKSQEMERRAQLSVAMSQARDDAEAKGQFMARISRDTKEALNSIMGYLTLAGEEENVDQRKGYVRDCQEQVRYLLNVLGDVIDLSAMENGTLALQKEPFELDTVLERLRSLFSQEAQSRGITFEFKTEEAEHLTLIGDRLRFEQVMMNLLSNAMLFTEKGSRVGCTLRHKDQKGRKTILEIAVECDGKAIPEDMLNKVFLPFEMASQFEKSSVHGGLGLMVTHNLVHVLGGLIKADNNEGKGIRFLVELPFGRQKKKSGAAGGKDFTSGKRLLVAEDNDLSAQVIEKLLDSTGFILDRANDGKEACEKFGSKPAGYYSAILMDLDMPNVDGCEATRLIRLSDHADAKKIPILAMTENVLSEDVAKAIESGMNGQVTKPIDKAQLLQTLKGFVE
ncbi:MAG: response regulator [Acidaminococcus sp.]|jgi:signal transduction histidine kinase/ActR/RegA family two-component response regulator|nr:response regulator [Acidaminococcus sp.]MCI2100173.1 response regulator [Acidaminococcus sp.]MCI2114492.1 response regulator [Acidaminococcus sp.]MCI2116504.1 response regulator [Acidaminococcus sp.]